MSRIHPARRLLPLFLMALFAAPCLAQSMYNDIYVPSAGAGGGDLIVRLYHPASGTTRYGAEGAVVVVVPGGTEPGSLDDDKTVSTILREGLVVVKFLFPGGSWVDPVSGTVLSSAGAYDNRGRNCILALRDVVRYCLGLRPDSSGFPIAITLPEAKTTNVGVLATSNGGNTALVTMARHGAAMPGLTFFAGWENPSNGQTCVGDLGTRGHDPDPAVDGDGNGIVDDDGKNPYVLGYGSHSMPVDFANLVYDLSTPTTVSTSVFAGMAFHDGNGNGILDTPLDANGNGVIDKGEDFPLTGFRADFGAGMKLVYSVSVRRALLTLGLAVSADVATLAQTSSFWRVRQLTRAFPRVAAHYPKLLSMPLFSASDHVQAAHPFDGHFHVQQLLDGLDGASLWHRLNPDLSYVDLIASRRGTTAPAATSDNDANIPVLPGGLHLHAEPKKVPQTDLQAAAVTELADRVESGNRTANLATPLVSHP